MSPIQAKKYPVHLTSIRLSHIIVRHDDDIVNKWCPRHAQIRMSAIWGKL